MSVGKNNYFALRIKLKAKKIKKVLLTRYLVFATKSWKLVHAENGRGGEIFPSKEVELKIISKEMEKYA